jgi:hypothetical protein
MTETPRAGLADKARQELAAAPAESDAAVVLSQALDDVSQAAPEKRDAILQVALKQADAARRFKISEEAPLPDGWPKPSLPGLVRIKRYPQSRIAWVDRGDGRNGQFMTLFRHIKDRDISMTAPVVMAYQSPAASKPSAMAFLYRRTDQAPAGQFGAVDVRDDPPVTVVSIGLMGAYRESSFRTAADKLRQWLSNHPQWQAAGPVRVLGYNSPFMWFWRRYSEVQIPVVASR